MDYEPKSETTMMDIDLSRCYTVVINYGRIDITTTSRHFLSRLSLSIILVYPLGTQYHSVAVEDVCT